MDEFAYIIIFSIVLAHYLHIMSMKMTHYINIEMNLSQNLDFFSQKYTLKSSPSSAVTGIGFLGKFNYS